MILTYSFSTKYQIQANTTKEFINDLEDTAKHFREIDKLGNVELVLADPGHHTWQLETEDPKKIKKAKKLGFRIEKDCI